MVTVAAPTDLDGAGSSTRAATARLPHGRPRARAAHRRGRRGRGRRRRGRAPPCTRLAELLEGSVGATRPVTDDGRLPKDRLIGQTGKTVAPELYLALGLSGSPHHMAGVQGAQRILAVNRDPTAPIFEFWTSDSSAICEAVLPASGHRDQGRGGGEPTAGAAPRPEAAMGKRRACVGSTPSSWAPAPRACRPLSPSPGGGAGPWSSGARSPGPRTCSAA